MADIVIHAYHVLNAVKTAFERLNQSKERAGANMPRDKELLSGIEKAATAALDLMGSQALVALTVIELSVIRQDLLAQRQ